MHWTAVKVFWEADDSALMAELVADVFYELGLKGLEIEDPDMEPPADGWGEPVRRPERYAVVGYFPSNDRLAGRLKALDDGLERIAKTHAVKTWRVCREIDEQDWAESWKAFFWPRKVTRRLVVKPTWRRYTSRPGEIVIELDPGMAFGTGTHPTTTLCLAMIEKYLPPRGTFLDVGCGSGILMIAAAKLEASRVWGVDIDEVAVAVTRQNLRLNGVEPSRCRVITAGLGDAVRGPFALVASNILSEVIVGLTGDVRRVLAPDGVWIASGITVEKRSAVVTALKTAGFSILDVRRRESWVAIAARRNEQ